MSEPDQRGFSIKQAAKYCGVSKSTIWRAVQAGQLHTFKLLGCTTIERWELDALFPTRGDPSPA